MGQQELDFINDAARQLLQAASRAMDVQEVLNVAYNILKLPICLTDPALCDIASCGMEGLNEEELDRNDDDDLPSRRRWMQVMQQTNEPLIDDEGKAPFRVMCYNVRLLDTELGKLSMFETRPFQSTDSEILKLLASALTCVLSKTNPYSPVDVDIVRSSFLRDIITEQITPAQLEKRMQYFGIPNKQARLILVMEDMEQNTAQYTRVQIQCNHLFGAISLVLGNRIVLLIEGEQNIGRVEQHRDFYEHNFLYVGSSRVFYYLEDARDFYLQAVFALQTCQEQGITLLHYDKCFIEHMISLHHEKYAALSICRPEILRLWEYDKQYNTQLVATLELYCQCMCNMAETARASYLHYNSIKYRLSLIKEVSGIEKIDAQDLCEFLFSFSALRRKEISKPLKGENRE